MSKVIDFAAMRLKKDKPIMDDYSSNHDVALDYLEEMFPHGVILITLSETDIEVSSTFVEKEVVAEILKEATVNVKNSGE